MKLMRAVLAAPAPCRWPGQPGARRGFHGLWRAAGEPPSASGVIHAWPTSGRRRFSSESGTDDAETSQKAIGEAGVDPVVEGPHKARPACSRTFHRCETWLAPTAVASGGCGCIAGAPTASRRGQKGNPENPPPPVDKNRAAAIIRVSTIMVGSPMLFLNSTPQTPLGPSRVATPAARSTIRVDRPRGACSLGRFSHGCYSHKAQ